MSDQYFIVNIRTYLDQENPAYIGENSLYRLFSDFSCPPNPDVEHFLYHNAIEFTKKNQSVTYLVFNSNDASITGYFSLSIKPITISTANISKTTAKKLSRASIFNENNQSYTTVAYLIAQLGKNYSLPREKRIDGNTLLDFSLKIIENTKYSIGGILEFLECESNSFLMDFYVNNKFKPFSTRVTTSKYDGKPILLNQLLKFI